MIGVNPSIQFFPFGSNGVLVCPGFNKLWVLNPVAATIWCLLPECADEEDLQKRLAALFHLDLQQAAADATKCLDYFCREGLLAGGVIAPEFETENPLNIQLGQQALHVPDVWEYEAHFNLPDRIVKFLSTDCRLGKQFTEDLLHLRFENCFETGDAEIMLMQDEQEAWTILLDGRIYAGGIAHNSVLPHLYFLLFTSAMQGLNAHFLMHGAVLERDGIALVLPGIAGSGKTTLAAILAIQGWQLYSDELVVLDVQTGTIRPCPFPMSIKPGSVDVLQPLYPELPQRQLWNRDDGQQVRYLLPPKESMPDSLEEEAKPAVLIFPKYTPESDAALEEIGKEEALGRLAETGSSNRDLQTDDVQAMIRLVEGCPVYSLVFAEARKAVALIEEVAGSPSS